MEEQSEQTWIPDIGRQVRNAWQVILRPSFHPNCCITVYLAEDGPWIEITGIASLDGRKGIPSRTFQDFREAMTGIDFRSMCHEGYEPDGLDGITVRGRVRESTELSEEFKQWQPDPRKTPNQYRFTLALLRVAREVYQEPPGEALLLGTQEYLTGSFDAHLAKPTDHNYVGATPNLVLAGKVRECYRKEFHQLLNEIPPEYPLLISVWRPWLGVIDDSLISTINEVNHREGLTVWETWNDYGDTIKKLGVPVRMITSCKKDAVSMVRSDSNFKPEFEVFVCDENNLRWEAEPREIIISGKVTTNHRREFSDLLEAESEAALVRVTNSWLGIADEELSPVLRHYQERFPTSVWILNEVGMDRLAALGIDQSRIFYSSKEGEEAYRLLNSQ